uniref:Cationic amino acid transporter C-terminal domain-containing protein n=1 Tax=Glossina brevipalpis TaxID=37001 RepID=A0A1A9WDQ4_9MUSC
MRSKVLGTLVKEKIKFKIPLPPGITSATLIPKLIRTKDVKQLQDGKAQASKPKLTVVSLNNDITSTNIYLYTTDIYTFIFCGTLQKCLDTLDLTSLGVGSCCGTGMYLVAGMVAKNIAGPGVVISFVIAAIASTSACACALSSSFDSLTGGAVANAIGDSIGTIFGKPPDFIAFGITLIMTFILALGASKSVMFNHILNAINLATWVFVMTAGMFYVDSSTWTEHQGFLPYGWSGVFSGAATCFYAFIGFDIIATTGEEAHNPQKSIPKAIVGSLFIVLLAYVTVSLVLTLVVPYDHINTGAALVQMWSYVNAPKCRIIVAIGATAGLSVAMFGSMFPMPRVIYAMAQDGLIFKQMSQLWQRTNVPGLATLCSGAAAALVALTVRLEILVEMMSIGTLLAYTLVSTCVLVLRYQPHSTSLVELLPAQLRTPINPNAANDPHSTTAEVLETNTLTIKRVTRGLSDSDDSMIDESPDGYLGRDDQFLVSDRSENKFYGAVHGAPTGPTGQATAFDSIGMYVTKLVGLMFGLIFFLDLFAAIGLSGGFAIFIYFILFIGIFVILLIISRQPQNRYALAFLTPGLPFIPAIAITVNIYLIFKLSILTLVRFTIWMSLGFIMYFYYGITHSTLEQTTEELELKVDKDYNKNRTSREEKAVWDQPSYLNQTHEPVWASKDNTQHATTKHSTRTHCYENSLYSIKFVKL